MVTLYHLQNRHNVSIRCNDNGAIKLFAPCTIEKLNGKIDVTLLFFMPHPIRPALFA